MDLFKEFAIVTGAGTFTCIALMSIIDISVYLRSKSILISNIFRWISSPIICLSPMVPLVIQSKVEFTHITGAMPIISQLCFIIFAFKLRWVKFKLLVKNK